MIFLILFAFLAGVVTIASPCILPILPLVLSAGLGEGKRKPFGVVVGFIASFTFFTLALAALVRLTGLSANALRTLSVVIIGLFGLSLLFPQFQLWMEHLFSRLSSLAPKSGQTSGFFGGFLLGLSLGLLWTPCVGPILASVITLAATSTVTLVSVFIVFAYALGTGLPMLLIIYGGRQLLKKVPWLLKNTGKIQKAFGVIMLLVAVGIFFNVDRTFQTYVIQTFPSYGAGLTQFEDNALIKKQLEKFQRSGSSSPEPSLSTEDSSGSFPIAPELIPGGEWFNSTPLTLADLRGKVVLIDFWTYTCINCIRTLPYLEKWHETYADKGLVIIGVHTPEFEFEKNPTNVRKAIQDFGLKYPVMQDNAFATWRSYNNHYWPAKYFIDKNGRIRDSHFGEGDYDESERFIQELLKETGASVDQITVDNPVYSVAARTPETYVGYDRLEYNVSPEAIKPDKESSYSTPPDIPLNRFAYAGRWTIAGERAVPASSSALTLHFEAGQVFLVMRAKQGLTAQVKVYLDGSPIAADSSGEDVKNGVVSVVDDRLYKLINLKNSGKHLLRLEFLDGNTELYAFTFG